MAFIWLEPCNMHGVEGVSYRDPLPIREWISCFRESEVFSLLLTGKREFSTRSVSWVIVKRWGLYNFTGRWERTRDLISRNTNKIQDLITGSGSQRALPSLKRRDSRKVCRQAGLFFFVYHRGQFRRFPLSYFVDAVPHCDQFFPQIMSPVSLPVPIRIWNRSEAGWAPASPLVG